MGVKSRIKELEKRFDELTADVGAKTASRTRKAGAKSTSAKGKPARKASTRAPSPKATKKASNKR